MKFDEVELESVPFEIASSTTEPAAADADAPRLKRLAPEMYDRLYCHRSLVRLWLEFFFNPDVYIYRLGRAQQYAKVAPPGLQALHSVNKPR